MRLCWQAWKRLTGLQWDCLHLWEPLSLCLHPPESGRESWAEWIFPLTERLSRAGAVSPGAELGSCSLLSSRIATGRKMVHHISVFRKLIIQDAQHFFPWEKAQSHPLHLKLNPGCSGGNTMAIECMQPQPHCRASPRAPAVRIPPANAGGMGSSPELGKSTYRRRLNATATSPVL